jgi:hypothetical protein
MYTVHPGTAVFSGSSFIPECSYTSAIEGMSTIWKEREEKREDERKRGRKKKADLTYPLMSCRRARTEIPRPRLRL